MHNINIQKETFKILEEIQKMLPKTKELEKIYKNTLDNEQLKLSNLEYVIAFVGTIKAGKSTIINAIVGKEVLPHRTEAMTTLPTLITHVLGQEIPILKLTKIEPLEVLLQSIKKKIGNDSKSGFLKTDEGHDFKERVLEDNFVFLESYSGEKEIFEFLKTLNDMLRTAKELDLEPPFKEFENINQLPRIEVEFKYLNQHEVILQTRLSLLDTPGPNEFKHSEHLKEIFESQLRKASSVVLVINYPQISSMADGEIGEQFAKAVDFVGKEHMFVFANQLDNVNTKDAVPEKIKNNIAENKFDGKISKENVFPMSAKKAFFAQLGIAELEKNGKIDKELHWRVDFGETILGDSWEEHIDNLDKVKEKCASKWKSYFEEALHTVIADAHDNAFLYSIDSALNKLDEITKELQNSFKVQENAWSVNIEKLKEDIVTLKRDIEKIKEISAALTKEVEDQFQVIQKELEQLIQNELQNASKTIMTIFEKKEEELPSAKKEEPNKYGGIWGIFQLEVKEKSVQEQMDELTEIGELKFSSKEDALKFTSSIAEISKQHTLQILDDAEAKFQEKSKSFAINFNISIQAKLGDLLENIKQNLGTDIAMELPCIEFNKNSIEVKQNFSKTIKTRKDPKSRKVEKDYICAGIIRTIDFFGNDWGYEWEDYTEKHSSITKEILEKTLHEIFDKVSEIIQKNARDIYTNSISVSGSEILKKLTVEIENDREEKLNIEKKREADAINIEEEISSAKISQKIVDKLQKRIGMAQTILREKNHE